MYELIITPKHYTNVSASVRKFLDTKFAVEAQKAVVKPYEYIGAGSRIENGFPSLPLPYNRHPYFDPTTVINRKDEEVAKHIKILG